MPRGLLDRNLLDALEQKQSAPLQKEVWRVAWRSQDVLKGGSQGRWNRHPLVALYTSLAMDGAIAEVYALLSKAPVLSSADKLIYRLEVKTQNTIILENPDAIEELGVRVRDNSDENLHHFQSIGEAAFRLDYDSLLVPSLRWECSNLVLFPELIDPSDIRVSGDAMEINWPAWAESNMERSRRHTRSLVKPSE